MKLNLVLEQLFEQAGLKDLIADEKLKAVFALETEVEDEISDKLTSGLMGMNSALNNGKIKAHHIKNYLKGSEDRLKAKIESSELDEATKLEILGEAYFNERVEKFIEAVSKKATEAPKQTDGAQKKYAEAMAKLEEYEKNYIPKTELEKIQIERQQEREQLALRDAIGKFEWSDAFDKDVRLPVFKMSLEAKLNEIGAKAVYDNGTFKLVQKDSPDLEYFDSKNKKVTFDDISKDLAFEKKFIKVAQTTQNTGQNLTTQNNGHSTTLKNPDKSGNQNQALKDLDDDIAKFNVK